jgi:heavy metal translocating P-type ATPase
MIKLKEFFSNEEKRTILFLSMSGISLIMSFIQIWDFPIDPAWLAILLCGIPIIKGALEGLLRELDIKADVLVSLALIASVIIGEIFAAGEVAFIMAIGALLEERTVAKARAGIEKLVHLTPRTARRIEAEGERIIPAEMVKMGDLLRVLAGESIAVDGVILNGQTSIDQSVMTGESLPVDKGPGDEVFSGTVNQFGTFEMKAVKVGEDSSLQRMIRLVESADAGKAKIVGIADRWATWIVVIALAAALVTWFVTGEIIRSVTILVVFCPCALVLATPTAIMAGIGNAAKFGILIREGDALEKLAKVKNIAFDKTGTLTYGKPTVIEAEDFRRDQSAGDLLALTASAELRSEHPLGRAIANHYKMTVKKAPTDPESFLLIPGRGVRAKVNGHDVLAGNAELLRDHSISITEEILLKAAEYSQKGCTVIYIAVDRMPAGIIALSDILRSDVRGMIRNIHRTGVKSVLITGDHAQAADQIAREAGINTIHSDCLPENKMSIIDSYQTKGEMVCMVGDGINDAPALKKAYVGVALGGIGSDIAVDAADIALVGDEIKYLPHLIQLAKKTISTIKINLTLSMVLNFAAIILAMTGILTPVSGALVHNVGSVAVIINSALLLKWKKNLQ